MTSARRLLGRRLFAWAIGWAAALLLHSTVHAQGAKQSDFADQVELAFWYADFEELERLYAVAKQPVTLPTGGDLQIDRFRDGIARMFRGDRNDAYYAQLQLLTQQWVAANPGSALARNLRARALYGRAWFLRGGAFAREVPNQAMAQFAKYIRQALDSLIEAPAFDTDATTNVYLIMILRSSSAPFDTQWLVAQNALDKTPTDFGVYQEIVASALPKWGGDAGKLDAIARDALRRTEKHFGLEFYARVYTEIGFDLEGSLFKESRADWLKIKQGYRDLLSRRSNSIDLNRLGFMACLAQDKATTLEVFEQLADKPDSLHWGGRSRGARMIDSCRIWARSN